MNQNSKKVYVAPEIRVSLIELEESIALGSAMVQPQNSAGQVKEEWNDGPAVSQGFTW